MRDRCRPGSSSVRRSLAGLTAVAALIAAVAVAPGPATAAPNPAVPTTVSTAVSASTSTAPPSTPTGIVVRLASGHSLTEITNAYPVVLSSNLLQSQGIYLVKPRAASDQTTAGVTAITARIASSSAVLYAEPNYSTTLQSSRYRSWPEGNPTPYTGGAADWLSQPAVTTLDLSNAHRLSLGVGVKVAVLDTGVDPTHPALKGHLLGGHDYIDGDSTPTDTHQWVDTNGNGTLDDAYGHGTFVSGLIALVAPNARIMPYRVLDSDGVGSVFVIAQAVLDAGLNGARVINLSFGTDQIIDSRLLLDAISFVQALGAVVVAAAGNSGTITPTYPAADAGVLSVSSMSGAVLSSWANRGSWVDVAAPGDSIIGPVPGGAYARWSGTSMATPFVAGQVALLRAAKSSASATTVFTALTSTCSPVSGVVNGLVHPTASLTVLTGH